MRVSISGTEHDSRSNVPDVLREQACAQRLPYGMLDTQALVAYRKQPSLLKRNDYTIHQTVRQVLIFDYFLANTTGYALEISVP